MLLKPQTPEDPEGTPSAINKRLAIRLHTMQHELQTLQHEHKKLQDEQKRLFSDLCAIAKALEVATIPRVFLVGPDGTIRAMDGELKGPALEKTLARLMGRS